MMKRIKEKNEFKDTVGLPGSNCAVKRRGGATFEMGDLQIGSKG